MATKKIEPVNPQAVPAVEVAASAADKRTEGRKTSTKKAQRVANARSV